MAEKGRGGIQWFLGAGLFVTATLGGIGGSLLAANRPYLGWFIAASWVFGATFLAAFWYFGLHHWILSADAWRMRVVAAARTKRHAVASVAPTASLTARRLEILDATYGVNSPGGGSWQVKDLLQGRVLDGYVGGVADNLGLGGDPAPSIRKTLKVTYAVDGGMPRVVEIDEGSPIDLP